jgi:hypothetical protein
MVKKQLRMSYYLKDLEKSLKRTLSPWAVDAISEMLEATLMKWPSNVVRTQNV